MDELLPAVLASVAAHRDRVEEIFLKIKADHFVPVPSTDDPMQVNPVLCFVNENHRGFSLWNPAINSRAEPTPKAREHAPSLDRQECRTTRD